MTYQRRPIIATVQIKFGQSVDAIMDFHGLLEFITLEYHNSVVSLKM